MIEKKNVKPGDMVERDKKGSDDKFWNAVENDEKKAGVKPGDFMKQKQE